MIELRSIRKPIHAATALEAEVAAPPRRMHGGSSGRQPRGESRAANQLLVRGKREERLPSPTGGGGGAIESIIGLDQRTRILETELAPWRMICALELESGAGARAIGTGWLAGPKTIITAGHCVYSTHFFGGWASTIRASAGRNGDDLPHPTVTATRFESVDQWIENENPDFDIGCIHLDQPLGDTAGWFAVAALPPDELRGYMVNVSGYPGDRGRGKEQYHHINRVLHVGERRVFYDVDTFGGQSGAPVFIYEDAETEPVVVGIHAYGIGGTPGGLGITANSAPRIIPEVFDIIQGWLAADGDNSNSDSAGKDSNAADSGKGR